MPSKKFIQKFISRQTLILLQNSLKCIRWPDLPRHTGRVTVLHQIPNRGDDMQRRDGWEEKARRTEGKWEGRKKDRKFASLYVVE